MRIVMQSVSVTYPLVSVTIHFLARFSSNSEAYASEIQENLKNIFFSTTLHS